MKKLTLLASAAFIVASMTSCKKDFTCTCTTSGGGYSASGSQTVHMKKKDAKAWCDGYDETYTSGGTTWTTACDLN